jgi:hypothetical protein
MHRDRRTNSSIIDGAVWLDEAIDWPRCAEGVSS